MTIINNQYNYLFIHIPKAAGKSIKQHLLQDTYGLYDRKVLQLIFALQAAGSYTQTLPVLNKLKLNPLNNNLIDPRIRRYCIENKLYSAAHLRADDLVSILGQDGYSRKFSFAFVRNPWDRCLSSYMYFRRKTFHPLHNIAMKMKFDDFLEHQDKAGMPYIGQQVQWIFDERGEKKVNYIGHVESICSDMMDINKRLGLEYKPFTANTNASKKRDKDYRLYYSDRSRDIVARHMSRDIELLGYSFD